MIFVTVGSQKFQFNRLLQYIDYLIENKIITDADDEVFAQTGYSDYKPINYRYQQFLDRDEFKQRILDSRIVITHGGTGAIIGAIKAGKRVIAVPRLCSYGEHVDDHQVQIVKQFIDNKLIMGVNQMEEMYEVLKVSNSFSIPEYKSNTEAIIEQIQQYISGLKSKER